MMCECSQNFAGSYFDFKYDVLYFLHSFSSCLSYQHAWKSVLKWRHTARLSGGLFSEEFLPVQPFLFNGLMRVWPKYYRNKNHAVQLWNYLKKSKKKLIGTEMCSMISGFINWLLNLSLLNVSVMGVWHLILKLLVHNHNVRLSMRALLTVFILFHLNRSQADVWHIWAPSGSLCLW